MTIVHDEPTATVTYTLDADAQIAAARANLWRYIRSRRAWLRLAIGAIILAVTGATVGIALGEDPLWWILIFAGEMILLIPLIYLVVFLTLSRRVRRLVSQSTIWTHPVAVTWSAAGMSSRAASGTSELAWSDYHGWHRAKSGFLLYFNDQQYQVVPASALTSGQTEALLAALERSGLRRL